MDVAVEFHSCSKTFNMTGDRIAFAVGNKQLISGLTKVKSQIDSGPPVYTQKVAAKALESYKSDEPPEFLKKNNQVYGKGATCWLTACARSVSYATSRKRLSTFGLNCKGDSMEFATKLLSVGVAVTPGVGFGEYGESYVRLAVYSAERADS